MKRTIAASCVVGLASFTGCATTTTLISTADRSAPTTPVDGADLALGTDGTVHWRAHEGRNAGKDFDVISNPAEIASATTATQAGDWETSYSSVAADGSVYLHAVDSHPDNARSLFDPPLLLAPSTLAAIDEVKVNSAMRVVTLPAATAERASGTGSRTVRYVGDETISVDGKPRVAKVVEIEFIAELTTARVVRQSTLWVLPGEGVVAEEWNETLTILKLFPSKSRQTSTRIGVELSARPRDHRPTSQ